MRERQASVVILGGGPGGYEAALVAAQIGARVTVVDSDGLGGACVLTDCVPSKTLIATSETMGLLRGSAGLGIRIAGTGSVGIDAPRLYRRVKALARAQSADVAARLAAEGVEVVVGAGTAGRGPRRRRRRPGDQRGRGAGCHRRAAAGPAGR